MNRALQNPIQRLVSLLGGRKRAGKDYEAILWLTSRKCIAAAIVHGVLEEIGMTRGVCGVMLLYERVPPSKALRRLEADIANIEVQLERRSNRLLEAERELLLSLAKRIVRIGDSIRLRIGIRVCSEEAVAELRSRLSFYGCRAGVAEVKGGMPSPFRAAGVLGRRGYYGSLRTSLTPFTGLALRLGSLYLVQDEWSVAVGIEPRLGIAVLLPVYAAEGALHTLITGPTGRGKTVLLSLIAMQLVSRGVEVYLIDPKGDLKRRIDALGLEDRVQVLDEGLRGLRASSSVRRALLVDEAWRVPRELLEAVGRQGRSKMLSLIAASQSPSDFPASLWSNASNAVLFGSQSTGYIEEASRLTGLDEGMLHSTLPLLGTGEFLLRYRWHGTYTLASLA